MTNAELIKALRKCGEEPYDITKPCKVSPWKLMRDAADALEIWRVYRRRYYLFGVYRMRTVRYWILACR